MRQSQEPTYNNAASTEQFSPRKKYVSIGKSSAMERKLIITNHCKIPYTDESYYVWDFTLQFSFRWLSSILLVGWMLGKPHYWENHSPPLRRSRLLTPSSLALHRWLSIESCVWLHDVICNIVFSPIWLIIAMANVNELVGSGERAVPEECHVISQNSGWPALIRSILTKKHFSKIVCRLIFAKWLDSCTQTI